MYKSRCEEGKESEEKLQLVRRALFLTIEKNVYAKKTPKLQVKDSDRMKIPRIFTKQKIEFSLWVRARFNSYAKIMVS